MHFTKRMLVALLCLVSLGAAAQWPEKPVRMVVPYAPGGTGDVLARLLANELRQTLGQPVIVENKPGAAGNIGVKAVAQAPADGYTLLVAPTNNFVINQFLYKSLDLDPLKAFAPVSILIDVPTVVFTSTSIPVKTYAEFVAYARAHPGTMNYGSPGTGTTLQLSAESLNRFSKLGMTHIPYQGASAVVAALVSGDVQMMLGGANLGMQLVRGGKLRALAVANPTRLAVLPDTPTFSEVGLGDFKARNWWAVAVRRGTPPDVIQRLASAVQAALQKPQIRDQLSNEGAVVIGSGPQEMARQLADEAPTWKQKLIELGTKVE